MKLSLLPAAAALLLLAAPAFAANQNPPPAGGHFGSGGHAGPGGHPGYGGHPGAGVHSRPVGGHFVDGYHNWAPHPGWRGDIRHFDRHYWRGGHWWHGPYLGVRGWWWVVGPNWYWYAAPVYPYPEPFIPSGSPTGFWYWCPDYQQYYPYVGACPSGWQPVPPSATP